MNLLNFIFAKAIKAYAPSAEAESSSKKPYKLTLKKRKTIEKLLHQGTLLKNIAKEIGINRTTLHRELRKCKDNYDAEEAHKNSGLSKNRIDWEIIGKRFGLLVVMEFANIYKYRSWWRCKCDCGKECIISKKMLADYCSPKRPLSCGCVAKQSKSRGERVPTEESALRKFQDLIQKREIKGECWEWTGYVQINGKSPIPKTSWHNKAMSVRKCMYLLMNGLSYEPNPVFAKCKNNMCFNPEHLTLERPEKRCHYD